jgi:D-alanyl-D-alanine carboxypeptidase
LYFAFYKNTIGGILNFKRLLGRFLVFCIVGILANQFQVTLGDEQSNSGLQSYNSNVEHYFTNKFDSILNNKNLKNTKFSICVYSPDDGKIIYQKNPFLFLKPASVTKLLTTYTALNLLGPDAKLITNIYTDDSNINDGVVNGNLYIQGLGDCLMTLSDLDELVRQISNLGIKKIYGNIIADGTFFDNADNRLKYSGDLDEVEPVAPITALSIEKNLIKINVNTKVQGDEPKIQVIPDASNFVIESNLKMNNARNLHIQKALSKRVKNKNLKNNPKNNPRNNPKYSKNLKSKQRFAQLQSHLYSVGLSVHSILLENGYQKLILSGRVNPNSFYSIKEFDMSPELTVASLMRKRLLDNGIAVVGSFHKLNVKDKKIDYTKLTKIAFIERPLKDLITEMNKNSDNYLAENLFKINGANFKYDSNLAKSAKKIFDSLTKPLNEAQENIIVNDGSGLSRRNRVSSQVIVNLLRTSMKKDYFPVLLNSLPIGGIDGTLEKRFKNSDGENAIFAKTGTHRDASALAGYVRDNDGKIYVFAFIFNGGSVGLYKTIENNLALILASFSKSKL